MKHLHSHLELVSLFALTVGVALVASPDLSGTSATAAQNWTADNGRFVFLAENVVSLKDLAGETPGDAESFHWINLMRGDIMLMSLVNHRYLATKPNEPGPVTVTGTGPCPDRKDGACFKWKAVK